MADRNDADFDQLLRPANPALYAAKRNGRGTWLLSNRPWKPMPELKGRPKWTCGKRWTNVANLGSDFDVPADTGRLLSKPNSFTAASRA